MIDNDPTTWQFREWLFVLLMPLAGGVVNWYAKVRTGSTRVFNIVELFGELATSGFVGLGVFMLLKSYDQPVGLCAALSGVSGHMATRLLFLLENYVEARVVAATKEYNSQSTAYTKKEENNV